MLAITWLGLSYKSYYMDNNTSERRACRFATYQTGFSPEESCTAAMQNFLFPPFMHRGLTAWTARIGNPAPRTAHRVWKGSR